MKVKIKKLHDKAVIPKYAHDTDAGLDLVAVSVEHFDSFIEYDTGIAVAIPEGHVGLIFPRSSISKKALFLSNSVGVIDSGYRGPIKFRFKQTQGENIYQIGDRIGQLIILPYPKVEFEEVDELDKTERGEGGYGSTGK